MPATRGSSRGRAAKARSGSKFTDQMTWEAGEKKYIQLVTPEDDWWEVDIFFGKIKGQTKNGNDRYETFIQVDDDDDRISGKFGIKPKLRTLSVAVQLEPVYEKGDGKKRIVDFEVVEDEDGKPVVGMINQSHIFYGYLYSYSADFGPPHETVFHVHRDGGDQNTQYNFTPVTPAIELDDEILNQVDLEAWVEEHSSDEIYELIEDLPDDWVFDRFQQKKDRDSGSRSSRSKGSTRSRRTRDEDDDSEETRPARRASSSRAKTDNFDRLRKRVASAKTLSEDDDADGSAEDEE